MTIVMSYKGPSQPLSPFKSPTVKRTARTKPNGRDSPANAARASAAADPEMSLTELRHNPAAENAAAPPY